jgi:GNAT superfamily N-acetyltransferase
LSRTRSRAATSFVRPDRAALEAARGKRLRDVIAAGLYPHLTQVEFPFAEANARMEWDGVPISRERLSQLRQGLDRAVALHRRMLIEAVERQVAAKGGERIYIDTSGRDQYQPTRAFYERNGFCCEARLKDFYSPGDDRVIYVKSLVKSR